MFGPRIVVFLGVGVGLAAMAFFAISQGGGQRDEPAHDRSREPTIGVEQETTVLSKVYQVDREYRSMMGPYSSQKVRLADAEQEELLWITGYEAVMVDADGHTKIDQGFMCHSNLDVSLDSHRRAMGVDSSFSSRLFTLSQGQVEVSFPPGFGIPILSSESLDLTTQVLDLNFDGNPRDVRHKVTVKYKRDSEIDGAMVPLFPASAYGLALIEGDDGYYGVREPREETHGPGCLPGESASDHAYEDGLGRTFSGHWVVPPGRQVNRTLVTHLMRLPYDTTIHYIAVHLHPFAESLELRDLTTDEVVFRSRADNFEGRIGLERVDDFSSREGIEVFRDHQYELISTYENTSEVDQDSMAVMYLYLRDLTLEKRLGEQRRRGGWRS